MLATVRTPLTEATACRIDALVAVPIDAEEADELQEQCRLALVDAHLAPAPAHRAIRKKLETLRPSATPGPSSWRNTLTQDVGEVAGGIAAICAWATMWARGRIGVSATALWTAATIAPVDSGWQAGEVPEGEERQRKLRPIACAESLVKLVETLAIDDVAQQMLEQFEPEQLGVGTPDGAPLIITLVRSWAEALQRAEGTEEQADEESLLGIDLENAYGRALRSACLEGCRTRLPRIAALAASQWRLGQTTVWQRAEGQWRRSMAERGGWQGSRLMQVLFCMGLEHALHKVPMLQARVAYQDDAYFFGKASHLAAQWPTLVEALHESGHRVRNHKVPALVTTRRPTARYASGSQAIGSPHPASAWRNHPTGRGGTG